MKMKRIIAREFDNLAAYKVDNSRWHKLEPKDLNELITFLQGVKLENGSVDTLDFLSFGTKRFGKEFGQYISIKNYVGVVQPNKSVQLEILPKIDYVDDAVDGDGYQATKEIFLRMLRSLKELQNKAFNMASLKAQKMPLYEIFISMYLQEVRQLVKHGLKSTYTEQEDNIRFYKGKLLVNQHVLKNIAHKERFYVAYDEYTLNRAENKLVKSTLLKLQKLTDSGVNSKAISRLLMDFELVDASDNYTKDFAKVNIDRSTKEYELLMQWSNVFLLDKSFTSFAGYNDARALLFPMERVYESYIARCVKKKFVLNGWKVTAQDKGYYLFEGRSFALQPDIVLHRDDKIVIMDTKWKRLSPSKGSYYGISQADMYQMYAYGKKYGTSEIWLLYPLNNAMRDHEDIVYRSKDKNHEDEVVVHVFFTDLEHIEESMAELLAKVEQSL